MSKRSSAYFFGSTGACFLFLGLSAMAQTLTTGGVAVSVTKLYDFSNGVGAAWNPYDTPVLIGNELWFTTEKGGAAGFGTLSKFDLTTNQLTTLVGNMGTAIGNTPQSSVTPVGSNLYYTTSRGGTGDRGTISVWNTATNSNTVLFSSPALGSGSPYAFPGNVTYVDLGNNTASLYAMYGSGNTGSGGLGGIVKLTLDTATQTVTSSSLIHTFLGGTSHLQQPFEGFTRVGDKLYFTTFTGGPNSAGGIGVLDLTNDTVNDSLAFLNPGDGSYSFGGHNPIYDAATNSLYMATVGNAREPGGLVKFDITSGTYSYLYELSSRTGSTSPNADGAQPYGPLTLLGSKIFFATSDGGANDSGTISMFDLTTNTYIKLFDLDSSAGNNLGGEARGGFAVTEDASGYHLFLTPRQGGTGDTGTILRIDVSAVPEPSANLMIAGCGLMLAGLWRRRSVHLALQ